MVVGQYGIVYTLGHPACFSVTWNLLVCRESVKNRNVLFQRTRPRVTWQTDTDALGGGGDVLNKSFSEDMTATQTSLQVTSGVSVSCHVVLRLYKLSPHNKKACLGLERVEYIALRNKCAVTSAWNQKITVRFVRWCRVCPPHINIETSGVAQTEGLKRDNLRILFSLLFFYQNILSMMNSKTFKKTSNSPEKCVFFTLRASFRAFAHFYKNVYILATL